MGKWHGASRGGRGQGAAASGGAKSFRHQVIKPLGQVQRQTNSQQQKPMFPAKNQVNQPKPQFQYQKPMFPAKNQVNQPKPQFQQQKPMFLAKNQKQHNQIQKPKVQQQPMFPAKNQSSQSTHIVQKKPMFPARNQDAQSKPQVQQKPRFLAKQSNLPKARFPQLKQHKNQSSPKHQFAQKPQQQKPMFPAKNQNPSQQSSQPKPQHNNLKFKGQGQMQKKPMFVKGNNNSQDKPRFQKLNQGIQARTTAPAGGAASSTPKPMFLQPNRRSITQGTQLPSAARKQQTGPFVKKTALSIAKPLSAGGAGVRMKHKVHVLKFKKPNGQVVTKTVPSSSVPRIKTFLQQRQFKPSSGKVMFQNPAAASGVTQSKPFKGRMMFLKPSVPGGEVQKVLLPAKNSAATTTKGPQASAASGVKLGFKKVYKKSFGAASHQVVTPKTTTSVASKHTRGKFGLRLDALKTKSAPAARGIQTSNFRLQVNNNSSGTVSTNRVPKFFKKPATLTSSSNISSSSSGNKFKPISRLGTISTQQRPSAQKPMFVKINNNNTPTFVKKTFVKKPFIKKGGSIAQVQGAPQKSSAGGLVKGKGKGKANFAPRR